MRRLKKSSRSSSGGRNRATVRELRGNVAEVEDAGVLEEELALFGKEQAELREVDLLLVGFGLREVRVDRGVEGQRRRDAGLHIDTGGQIFVEAAFANAAHRAAGEKRLDAQVAALPQWRQPGEVARR